jgi:hypothetical protein
MAGWTTLSLIVLVQGRGLEQSPWMPRPMLESDAASDDAASRSQMAWHCNTVFTAAAATPSPAPSHAHTVNSHQVRASMAACATSD